MPQTRLFLTAGKADAERIFARLEAVFEEEGLPVAIAETAPDSDMFEVSVYVDAGADDPAAAGDGVAAMLREAAQGADIGVERLDDIDWVARSLEGLAAVRAGRFIVHGGHQRGAVRAGDIGIEIEAGRAFGTGHHGTTSGCLIMLDRLLARRPEGLVPRRQGLHQAG